MVKERTGALELVSALGWRLFQFDGLKCNVHVQLFSYVVLVGYVKAYRLHVDS